MEIQGLSPFDQAYNLVNPYANEIQLLTVNVCRPIRNAASSYSLTFSAVLRIPNTIL